ncbi:MAG: Na+/H+ antiporter subunit E [Desulfofustis sp.]|nr:Na+/H+ antiporter subunit E [Desulfofustis sp.]
MNVENISPEHIPPVRRVRTSTLSARTRKGISFIIAFCICLATWIVLSGRFDALHLTLGVLASGVVALGAGTILISWRGLGRLPRQWLGFIGYIPWLLYQIFLANLHVLYLAFHPRMIELISPEIIHFKSRLKRPMSLFIFANSITLTPGTITVFVSITGEFAVHAIDEPSAASLPGKMEEKVARLMGE